MFVVVYCAFCIFQRMHAFATFYCVENHRKQHALLRYRTMIEYHGGD